MAERRRDRPRDIAPAAGLVWLTLAAAIGAQYALDRSLQRGAVYNAPRANSTMTRSPYAVNYHTGDMSYNPAIATGDPVYNRYRTPLAREQLRTDPTVPLNTRRGLSRPRYNPTRAYQATRSASVVASRGSALPRRGVGTPRPPGPGISTPAGTLPATRTNLLSVASPAQTYSQPVHAHLSPASQARRVPSTQKSLVAPTYRPGASTRVGAPVKPVPATADGAYWLLPPG